MTDENDTQLTFSGQLERFRQSPRLAKKLRNAAVSSDCSHVPTRPSAIDNASETEVSLESALAEDNKSPSSAKHDEASFSQLDKPRSSRKRRAPPYSFEGMAEIPDRLAHDLNILFCGYNPGIRSSEMGFHYAHPSNRFYRILKESGLTDRRLKPEESPTMPGNYSLGLTDLVARCTARADQVSSLEFQAGAVALLRKIIEYRPKMVCFVGMDVFRNFRKHFPPHALPPTVTPKKTPRIIKSETKDTEANADPQTPARSPLKQSKSDVQLGLQQLVLTIPVPTLKSRNDVLLYVIPSTSGLAAGYSDPDRVAYLQDAMRVVKDVKDGLAVVPAPITHIAAEQYLQDRIVNTGKHSWVLLKAEQDDDKLAFAI